MRKMNLINCGILLLVVGGALVSFGIGLVFGVAAAFLVSGIYVLLSGILVLNFATGNTDLLNKYLAQ